MNRFERVSKYPDAVLPERKTANSAGYDLTVAEDIIIPPYIDLNHDIAMKYMESHEDELMKSFLKTVFPSPDTKNFASEKELETASSEAVHNFLEKPLTLNELADLTKQTKARPTLVSTGIKCQLDSDCYLELSVRSSTPLKYWLLMANSVGIIDSDYYNNPDNEGEIFLQLINLSPCNIQLHKGDVIGQGIIKKYETTNDDNASGNRLGGFGSTSK